MYLGLIGSLTGRHETEYALFEVRNRLQAYSAEALNNVNVAGRMIQYGDLVDDLFTMENANVAFDGLYRPSGRTQSKPKIFTLLVADQDRVTPSLLAPISGLLRAEGMEFRNLQINRLDNRVIRPWVWSPRLSANTASLEHSAVLPIDHHMDWEIDLANRRVVANGLNYYQGLYERTARVLKVYNVDWDLPAARVYFRQWLRQVDRVVAALDEVRLVAERDDLQIRLVSLQSHFAPFFGVAPLRGRPPQPLPARHHVVQLRELEDERGWRTALDAGHSKQHSPSVSVLAGVRHARRV